MLKRSVADKTLKEKIIAYSAIKIMANFTEPYSMLNPDTNSDSPSAKSKGVRFSSANTVILHIKKINILNKIRGGKEIGKNNNKKSIVK